MDRLYVPRLVRPILRRDVKLPCMCDRVHALFSDRRVRTQAVRYLVTGLPSAAVEFSLFALLNKVVGWPIFYANYASIGTALVVNFLLSRYWTFGDRTVAP